VNDFWISNKEEESDDVIIKKLFNVLYTSQVFCDGMKIIIRDELQNAQKNTIFRENSVGISLLAFLWYQQDGIEFLKYIFEPLIPVAKRDTSLEIDTKRIESIDNINVKKNLEKIENIISQLLERIFTSSHVFPKSMQRCLNGLDTGISMRFPDMGLTIVGGILFLRLITPAILFPQKYNLINQEEITPHGTRALTLVGKILQAMANEQFFTDPPYNATNRFVRKNLPQWRSFFHTLVTGEQLKRQDSLISFGIENPEDLIAESNVNIYTTVCSFTQGKQYDMITKLLSLEKQLSVLEHQECDGYSWTMQKFKKSGVFMAKIFIELNTPIEKVYEKCHKDPNMWCKFSNQSAIYSYSDNLAVHYIEHSLPWPLKRREFLCLLWHEMINPNFAIFCATSMDYDTVKNPPPFIVPQLKKGNILAELSSGVILRKHDVDPNKCYYTHISHCDAKGNSKYTPNSVIKSTMQKKKYFEISKKVHQTMECD